MNVLFLGMSRNLPPRTGPLGSSISGAFVGGTLVGSGAGAFAAAFVGAGFGSSVASLEQDIDKTNIEPSKNTKTHL
jgi:hypothetical protein